ncbi:uncharacterized protein LOC125238263 [Leguminivora glycinivorella]|uniref:uncharacterized protein LOC125238263 n=1 Tax=Leguminivora glycinivorella TaxID=1035111 RepID=UPI00200CA846|nr:uncharacterized protein LOC125238263 [Leguminivora glycinivorella]
MHRISEHTLLEPPSPAYTNVTVRRAFIVWLHCGQANKFKDVCNYFHFLEGLEDQLSVDNRAVSRHHEFDLFTNPPPSSTYLQSHHPQLYTNTQLENYYVSKLEAIRNEKCVFKLEGFEEIGPKNGATKQQIVETSQLIRKYCLSHSITLKKFLVEFKEYVAKCQLTNNVQNVAFYIKRQMVKEEMTMIANCPKTFSFLEEDIEDTPVDFLSQMRLLDSTRLSPTMKLNGADVWNNENLKNKVSNAKNAFVKKPSQKKKVNVVPPPKLETPKYDVEYMKVIKQKLKNELMVL